MTIAAFDHLSAEEKKALLFNCCGSDKWVNEMMNLLPYEDLVDVLEDAEQVWYRCEVSDWLQAFDHHPKIGDTASLITTFADTAAVAEKEQDGIKTADATTIAELADLNRQYLDKNGFIFIVFATGKSGTTMLDLLKKRLGNDKASELETAAEEQNKITKLRLEKLFT